MQDERKVKTKRNETSAARGTRVEDRETLFLETGPMFNNAKRLVPLFYSPSEWFLIELGRRIPRRMTGDGMNWGGEKGRIYSDVLVLA